MNIPEKDPFIERRLVEKLLTQVVQRRPYISALALVSPGGRLWASALPDGVEAESVAAMAAPVALLGRRIALEQLGADMRQVYVEGEGGYAILRSIGGAAVLLIIAPSDTNLALILHDVRRLEVRVADIFGIVATDRGEWTEAGPAIERLRRLMREGKSPELMDQHLSDLRAKLESLDMGLFPERVDAIRAAIDAPSLDEFQHFERIETELLELERDVMDAIEQQAEPSVSDLMDEQEPATVTPVEPEETVIGEQAASQVEQETIDVGDSFFRRALRWLASMIESED